MCIDIYVLYHRTELVCWRKFKKKKKKKVQLAAGRTCLRGLRLIDVHLLRTFFTRVGNAFVKLALPGLDVRETPAFRNNIPTENRRS